ncbi:MAG: hypothetical protein U9N81_13245 [Bacillota bacterium]|nr:hypothetical protein [Bacillota bacterium]
MNIEKHLILVKGEDKTEEISNCAYEEGKWQINFAKGKTYSYQYLNTQWLKDPVLLDSAATIICENDVPVPIFPFGFNLSQKAATEKTLRIKGFADVKCSKYEDAIISIVKKFK